MLVLWLCLKCVSVNKLSTFIVVSKYICLLNIIYVTSSLKCKANERNIHSLSHDVTLTLNVKYSKLQCVNIHLNV